MTKKAGSRSETSDWASIDDQRVSLIRLILAVSAFLIIYIDPAEPDRLAALTYSVMAFYCTYSAIFCYYSFSRRAGLLHDYAHWSDIIWFSALVSLSSGTNSIFFFFYLFAVLVAAFRWGFLSGMRVALTSAGLFLLIGIFFSVPGELELNRLLLRPIYLVLLGYLISYWGGRELLHRRRLSLLGELHKLSNPRVGPVKSLGSILERVRKFYDADSCLLLMENDANYSFNWFEAERSGDDEAIITPENTDAGAPLLEIPRGFSIMYNSKRGLFLGNYTVKENGTGITPQKSEQAEISNVLADLLESRSFVTIPVKQRNQKIGRIFITSEKNRFVPSDIEFLEQVVDQVFSSIENIRLLDSFASDAIETQRQKISFDIHDSTIQPYIGLKLGLEALEMKADPESPLSAEIRSLVGLADTTIADLRNFVSDLKNSEKDGSADVLATSLEQQARKFREYYGISVTIDNRCDLSKHDRLAAEVFQMVAEGLSNIRRHTKSKDALIHVVCEEDHVVLRIENNVTAPANEFLPKSLASRANYLGGRLDVECGADATRVTVTVPKNAEIN